MSWVMVSVPYAAEPLAWTVRSGTGGTDGQRSRGRVVPKCPAGHPAFNAHSRHETDPMLSGYHIEMCAASKSHPEDGDATFVRRATGDQRCRRTTILLRQAKLVTPHHRVRPLMRGAR
jgi:hypothetical protein